MYNVTITAGMTSSSLDVDIIDNMIQDGDKMFTVTIRLISACLPVTIGSDTTSVTIIDDEGMLKDSAYSSVIMQISLCKGLNSMHLSAYLKLKITQ